GLSVFGFSARGGRRLFRLLLVLLGGWFAPMPAAHFLAQVGRLRIDWCQSIDRAERGRQPGQATTVEAALEELRRFLCTHCAGPRSEDHSDQPATVARRGCNYVVARRTDESGLH